MCSRPVQARQSSTARARNPGRRWNIDILPTENIAIGLEYKQGVDAGDTSVTGGHSIRNHDYWDAHVAWFVTKRLSLVAAFAETGDKDKFYRKGSVKNLGVGSGAVFSIQYQF